jgi:hypothetical protein
MAALGAGPDATRATSTFDEAARRGSPEQGGSNQRNNTSHGRYHKTEQTAAPVRVRRRDKPDPVSGYRDGECEEDQCGDDQQPPHCGSVTW